jgi:hypothetical protein
MVISRVQPNIMRNGSLLPPNLLGFDHLLHDFGLLNEECPKDSTKMSACERLLSSAKGMRGGVPLFHAVTTARATVRAVYRFLAFRDGCELAGAESGDLSKTCSVKI